MHFFVLPRSNFLVGSGSSLSLKVFSSAQSYKTPSLSKEDFGPQRQRNGHFRGLARFPLLDEGNSSHIIKGAIER